MYLKELIDVVVISQLSAALLKMLDPIETCILNIRGKTTLNSTALDIGYKHTWSTKVTDILLQEVDISCIQLSANV
jgi:hypothetical protein